jgi:hypothetical protein
MSGDDERGFDPGSDVSGAATAHFQSLFLREFRRLVSDGELKLNGCTAAVVDLSFHLRPERRLLNRRSIVFVEFSVNGQSIMRGRRPSDMATNNQAGKTSGHEDRLASKSRTRSIFWLEMAPPHCRQTANEISTAMSKITTLADRVGPEGLSGRGGISTRERQMKE